MCKLKRLDLNTTIEWNRIPNDTGVRIVRVVKSSLKNVIMLTTIIVNRLRTIIDDRRVINKNKKDRETVCEKKKNLIA